MKKTSLPLIGVTIVAALTILFFFLGWELAFRILAWISVAIIILFVIGVVAVIKDLRKEIGRIPIPMVSLIVLTGLLIACGFIFTRNVLNGLLLGFSIAGMMDAILIDWSLKSNRKKENNPAEQEQDAEANSGPLVMELDEMQKGDLIKMDTFTIGELFPWKEYVYPGDHVVPDMNMKGFDVVASYTDITPQEEQAFATSEIKVSIFEYMGVPFITMNYDDVVRLQFSINIQKMKEGAREKWVADLESSFVRVFLLESNDGTLQGIRHFELKMMPTLKRILAAQLESGKEEIDGLIHYGESQFDIQQMEVLAQYTEIVPKPEIEL